MDTKYYRVGKVFKLIAGGGAKPPECPQCDDVKPLVISLLRVLKGAVLRLSKKSR